MRYVAFLRAINVGGKNVIRMADLKAAFEGLGLQSVSTYLQSGNVLFESPEKNEEKLAAKIEATLNEMTGGDITVMLRSRADMQRIVASQPFANDDTTDNHRFTSFLRQPSDRELPRTTTNGDLEVLSVTTREVFSVPRPIAGRYGQPGVLIESKLKVRSTTRNWSVVTAIAERLTG